MTNQTTNPEGTMLRADFIDTIGNCYTIEGDTVREIAEQLSFEIESRATVYDDHGFIRGWIHSSTDWTAK